MNSLEKLDLSKSLQTRSGSRVKIYEYNDERIMGAYVQAKGLSGLDLRDLVCCSWDRSGHYITGAVTSMDLVYVN